MARPSRLDRLLGLLRTGPSEAARLAAGRQLGAIQREHPEQLHALLQRVLCYLFHEEWETRRAAAHALEEIAEAVTTWQPSHPDAASAEVEAAARDEASGAWLSFESFAIDRVLAHGAPLLASGGQEFEANDAADDRPHERLLRQRALLQEQLGLDAIGSAIGGREQREMMDLIKEDDVLGAGRAAAASHRAAAADAHQLAAARLIAEELAASGGALSERARNTLKRKARRAAKLATDGGADGVVVQLPMAKRARRLEPAAAPAPRATASDGSAGCPPVAAAAADDEGETAGAEGFAALTASGDDPAGDAVAALDDATAWESSACIRHEASAAFGQLMPLLPLEPGTADPIDMSAALRARKAAERPCVDQLLGVVVGGAPPRYELPMVLKTTLRPYQQAGVDWLAFLRRFGLHGILCDDMGLGKTLQTLCVELVVMSYETLRTDIDTLAQVRWEYAVLDEGHIIRNPKAQVARAAKRLRAARRLILTGTPLQNHALELWSLFDFLMPGYLGTQLAFQREYAQPIHASQGARAGEAAQLMGEEALARLHRQVLPLCLRRTKESVLTELPP
eukprot:jgi/Chrpa1/5239/Chrysochromulina_OHIO_Genome00015905-RA